MNATTQTLPLVKVGHLRALGVTRAQRVALFPEVPAIAEMLPGYDIVVCFGFFGLAGMPRDITARLTTEINRKIGDQALPGDVRNHGQPQQLCPAGVRGRKKHFA